jgi:replication factor C subunit 3/5
MDFSRLWVDKYRPKDFTELTFNKPLNNKLLALSRKDNYPHMCFYGPDGCGKKTRIMCFLNEVYGKGVYKFTKETWTTKVNSTTIEVPLLSSKFHIDITPSDAEHHDRVVLQQ